jgi:predicted enzyme related to lactoylglutathione lyase
VNDCEAAVAAAKANGGSVLNGPFDTPAGRMAVLQDPHGGQFSVLTPPKQ